MRSKRFILLLDLRYEVEREVYGMIKAAPDGEGAAFVRALMLMGFNEIKRSKATSDAISAQEKGSLDES
ncbi:hypothetical protein ALO93_200184 [Pseudomonas amygdali pv. sesami]|nr:hypothetical protein ALO93_200184 [Pseudomonas amygdali pv. sesami]